MILVLLDPNLTQDADADPDRRQMLSRMELARAERDTGMQTALDHAQADLPEWGGLALAYLRNYAETHDRFPAWFATGAANLTRSVPVRSGKAWGSIFVRAQRLGWIVKDGFRPDPLRHMNPAPVWRSLLFRMAA